MAIDLAQLKTELNTDPRGYGYAPHITAGRMQALADLMNQIRPEIGIVRKLILREQVLACWDLTEMEELYAANPLRLEWICLLTRQDFQMDLRLDGDGSGPFDRIYSDILGELGSGGANTTGTAMGTLQIREGSRAEELWAAGDIVTWQQCRQALNS
jgi:hypothetical protein